MPWSSVHSGDYQRMRKHLTVALLEAEAMEPRIQFAYARGEIPDIMAANMGLVRLLLERADKVTRKTLDALVVEHHDIYSNSTYTDRGMAESDVDAA